LESNTAVRSAGILFTVPSDEVCGCMVVVWHVLGGNAQRSVWSSSGYSFLPHWLLPSMFGISWLCMVKLKCCCPSYIMSFIIWFIIWVAPHLTNNNIGCHQIHEEQWSMVLATCIISPLVVFALQLWISPTFFLVPVKPLTCGSAKWYLSPDDLIFHHLHYPDEELLSQPLSQLLESEMFYTQQQQIWRHFLAPVCLPVTKRRNIQEQWS